MRKLWIVMAAVIVCVLAVAAVRMTAQSSEPAAGFKVPISDTYVWHGELVALDAPARTVTLKSRVVGEDARAEFERFTAGERVTLTWSGYDKYADAISRAVRYDASKTMSEPFTFPVEFVSYDRDRQYATFKIQVPEASLEAIRSLNPGEWVTVTSRHRPAAEADVLAAINPYVTTSGESD